MAPWIIAVIGGLDADMIMTTDRIPAAGESRKALAYREALGGKGANSAVAVYRSCHPNPVPSNNTFLSLSNGHHAARADVVPASQANPEIVVKMIGAVGADKHGEAFKKKLGDQGIDTGGIKVFSNLPTSICFVIVEDKTRENRCLFTAGATASWRKEDFNEPEKLGNGIKPDLIVVQMEIERDVVEAMIVTAGRAGIDVCLNAAPAHHITFGTYRYITHLLVNESEAAILSGREFEDVNKDTWEVIAKEFLAFGVKNVVITLGANGAFFANADASGHVPAYKVEVEDSTGAGDTFTGTYATAYLKQKAQGKPWDIREAIARAHKAAALTIQHFGAQEGIPWEDEIDRFRPTS